MSIKLSHESGAASAPLLTDPLAGSREETESTACTDLPRLNHIFNDHYRFVWRLLRRLAVAEHLADDIAQKVFLVAARRLDEIKAGSERSFLFGTAIRAAADARQAAARVRELPTKSASFEAMAHPEPAPDQILERKQARASLDGILLKMDPDLRTVFVLFELEGLTMAEMAVLLEIPPGTVASRLRRAREAFFARVDELKANGGRQDHE